MIFQKKQSIVLRNFFSVIMLILITVLACRQLNVAIQKGNVDYWTLQQTASSPEKSYQLFYSARVQKMERTKTATQIWLAPDKRPEVNLNTPLMTCFVKVIMRAKTTVMNASVWIALSLLCAAISIALRSLPRGLHSQHCADTLLVLISVGEWGCVAGWQKRVQHRP